MSQKPKNLEVLTFHGSIYKIQDHPLYKSADVIHLHWVSNNFLDYKSFFFNNAKPIVWTLHDMNPFTGGCHFSEDCEGYLQECLNCPQLKGTEDPNYTNKMLQGKLDAMKNLQNITIVAPSKWLLNKSKESRLFRNFTHLHIPYGIDSEILKPRDKKYSRELLGIPDNKPVILFVAHAIGNKRKGYEYLIRAIEKLDLKDKVTLCAVGGKSDSNARSEFQELGTFSDERLMSAAYSAADVFVIPSLEDNLPNTVLESLLCGTPVIGFPTGGIKEMIEDGKNGFLCNEISVNALVDKLDQYLREPEALEERSKIRSEAVKKYDSQVQVKQYITLYKELLQNNLAQKENAEYPHLYTLL